MQILKDGRMPPSGPPQRGIHNVRSTFAGREKLCWAPRPRPAAQMLGTRDLVGSSAHPRSPAHMRVVPLTLGCVCGRCDAGDNGERALGEGARGQYRLVPALWGGTSLRCLDAGFRPSLRCGMHAGGICTRVLCPGLGAPE